MTEAKPFPENVIFHFMALGRLSVFFYTISYNCRRLVIS